MARKTRKVALWERDVIPLGTGHFRVGLLVAQIVLVARELGPRCQLWCDSRDGCFYLAPASLSITPDSVRKRVLTGREGEDEIRSMLADVRW